MSEANVLIIDADNKMGTFHNQLRKRGFTVRVALDATEVKKIIHGASFDVAIINLKTRGTNGLSLLRQIKRLQPKCEVIMMTGPKAIRTAVKAMQLGAFDCIEKSIETFEEMENLILRAIHYGREGKNGQPRRAQWSDIAEKIGFQVGSSQAMQKVISKAYTIAKKDVNVLIQGETGTGKDLLARFIHCASNRSDRVFIPLNCGALPENLLESELFGHEKGSFTGAARMRKGIFEMSNGGTLFLDEVGEASLSIQVKLLRVLETGEFLRVGGQKPVKTDVRVISATNVNLEESIRDKKFREDLFYRLNVVRLELPPLRERPSDIPLLAEYFVKKLNPDMYISIDTMNILCNYPWPGNIRELYNAISQMVALCDESIILPKHLGKKFFQSPPTNSEVTREASLPPAQNIAELKSLEDFLKKCLEQDLLNTIEQGDLANLDGLLRKLERKISTTMRRKGTPVTPVVPIESIEAEAIHNALIYYNGNVSLAAKALGIGRNTIYRKIKQYEGRK